MRKSIKILTAIGCLLLMFTGVKVYANELTDVINLINEGYSIQDGKDSSAFIWVNKVVDFKENHKNSSAYSFLSRDTSSAKFYNDITTNNEKNKIIGELLFIENEITGNNVSSIIDLISNINQVDPTSSFAYMYVLEANGINENNRDSSVYSSLKSNCSSAMAYSDISLSNSLAKIIADLVKLYNEIPISSSFEDIIINSAPKKLEYYAGESFNPKGLEVSIKLVNTYKDGSQKEIIKKVDDYIVDTTTELTTNDTIWKISYTYNGEIKNVYVNIVVVNKITEKVPVGIDIISYPKKTEYLTGEAFDSKGLRVDVLYKNTWINGDITYSTVENVDYIVDEETALKSKDKKWTVSYTDNGETVETSIKIKVNNGSPTLNYTKKTLYHGDAIKLKVFGTDKYVMWKSSDNDVATVSSDGVVTPNQFGKAKITAIIGAGKTNVKLKCVITVKPKLSVDKKVVFLELDEYESVYVNGSKLTEGEEVGFESSYNVNVVSGGKNNFLIVPQKGGLSQVGFRIKGYGRFQYSECTTYVFVYSDSENKKISLGDYEVYKDKNGEKIASFSFSGSIVTLKGKKLINELEEASIIKKSRFSKGNVNIKKSDFEKIIKKAVKQDKISFYRYGF